MARSRRRFRRCQKALRVLIPLLGLTYIWGRHCRWPNWAKCLVTAAFVLICAAAILAPTPGNTRENGITIVSSSVAVYGPEMPTQMESEYAYSSAEIGESVVSTAMADYEEGITFVYASKGQDCYHRYTCKYAYASGQRLTLYEAHFLGYEPCPLCRPPIYGQTESGGSANE